ncbi:Uncharacterized protein DBV15_05217 [Temnothorax longispinosus]|uniref:Uncharacterized protein n=1 Tax=Temnothorax longispinosus TaxID=300112 RepID=A0A4S2KLG0_9HYME|nr:Uncharacterized protein DBV15_05217 [Temnothorax longispinosus]
MGFQRFPSALRSDVCDGEYGDRRLCSRIGLGDFQRKYKQQCRKTALRLRSLIFPRQSSTCILGSVRSNVKFSLACLEGFGASSFPGAIEPTKKFGLVGTYAKDERFVSSRGARGSLISYRTVYLTYQHILQTAFFIGAPCLHQFAKQFAYER